MKTILISICLFGLQNLFCQDTIITSKVNRNPYYKNTLVNNNDTITYYLSEFDKEKELPLIIYIQGSGYHSLFTQNQESIRPTSGHINLPYLSKGKAEILIIEKPGVKFLDKMLPGIHNKSFDRNFSLETWSTRISKVIDYVLSIEKINASKIMLIGHSEGGLVAARVANMMGEKISKISIMAGEGPSQLFSLCAFAKSGELFNDNNNEKDRLDYILKIWNEIKNNPSSTNKYFLGFTYFKWYSFLKTSVIEELSDFNGSVLILQGDEDKNVHPNSALVLYTSLISKDIDTKLEIINGADHSFNIKDSNVNGWEQSLKKIIDWFL